MIFIKMKDGSAPTSSLLRRAIKVCPGLRFINDFRYDGAGRGVGIVFRKKVEVCNGLEHDGRPMGGSVIED